MTRAKNYEENWDDIEFPETGLLINNDHGLSTTSRELSGITINDSSDDESEEDDYFGNVINYNSNKSTPASSSSSSSINKVKEMMINSGVVITNNKEEFSGLITRIGDNNKVIAVGDDWDNDLEIPEDGLTNLIIANKRSRSRSSTTSATNDFEFDSWDEEEQSTAAKNSITSPKGLIIRRIKDPSKVHSAAQSKKSLENFDDDFDFSGVDLNKLDLSAEALKLHQKSKKEEGNLNDKDPFEPERVFSRNSSRLSMSPSPGSQSAFESGEEDSFDDIQFPEHMDSLTLISHNDDDDFENGLDIDDESVFDLDRLKNRNIITRPNPVQQKRTRRESFSIEFNTTSPKDSRSSTPSISLADNKDNPKTTNNNSVPVSSLQRLKTNKDFSRSLTTLRTSAAPTTTKNNTSKSTLSKNQINRPTSPQRSKSPKLPLRGGAKKSMSLMNSTLERPKSALNVTNPTGKPSPKKTAISNSTPSNKCIENNPKRIPSNNKKRNTNSNNAYDNNASTLEIMRKPKRQQNFGDGTELDGFDDLPINVDRERLYVSSSYTGRDRSNSFNSNSSVSSKTDRNDQRNRKYKNNHKRKKPQLIRNLNVDKNRKVVGEMTYNPETHRWDGNDTVLKDFDNVLTGPTRPALISNMNNRAMNTKSLQVVGKMKFDPIKMCWNNDSPDEEKEIWASFDCDDDQNDFNSPPQAFGDSDISSSSIKKNSLKTKYHRPVNGDSTNSDNNDFQVGLEFDITPGFLAALLASERQHRNEITRWYPDALSKKNDSRFGLRDITLQRSYLYDLRNNNNNKRNFNNSSSGNNSKIYHNRSGGLFEAAMNLTRPERRHFR